MCVCVQPVAQNIKVDHNPGGGHWFAAGLSPNVSLMSLYLSHYFNYWRLFSHRVLYSLYHIILSLKGMYFHSCRFRAGTELLLITARTFRWFHIHMAIVMAVLEVMAAIMIVQGLEAAMEVMEIVVICLHIIHLLVHLG